MTTYVKGPNDVLDYGLDWSSWLAASETINTSSWSVPSGITAGTGANGAAASSHTTTSTTIWLFGGTDGSSYALTNRVVTSGGRTIERPLTIKVRALPVEARTP